jgi:hypothetical protein
MPPLEKITDYGYSALRAANFSVPRLSVHLTPEEMDSYGRKLHESHTEYKRRATWMAKLDQLIEEVRVELNESRTLLAAFEPYKRHQEGCKVLQMEVKRFQLELEGLQEKKRLAERFEKLRVTYAQDRLEWTGLDPCWTAARPGTAAPPTAQPGLRRSDRLRHHLEDELYKERFQIQMERCRHEKQSLEMEIGRLQDLYVKWSPRGETAGTKAKRSCDERRLFGMTTEDFLEVICRRITAAEREATRVLRRRTQLMKEETTYIDEEHRDRERAFREELARNQWYEREEAGTSQPLPVSDSTTEEDWAPQEIDPETEETWPWDNSDYGDVPGEDGPDAMDMGEQEPTTTGEEEEEGAGEEEAEEREELDQIAEEGLRQLLALVVPD